VVVNVVELRVTSRATQRGTPGRRAGVPLHRLERKVHLALAAIVEALVDQPGPAEFDALLVAGDVALEAGDLALELLLAAVADGLGGVGHGGGSCLRGKRSRPPV
jgi:hypothetical protein